VFRDQQDVDACVLGIRNTPKLMEEDLKLIVPEEGSTYLAGELNEPCEYCTTMLA